MIDFNQILQASKSLEKKLVENRRHIHKFPELSFNEKNTGDYVYERLKELGFNPQKGVGDTGVVAQYDSGTPGKIVAIRSDMDALPINETNPVPYCSTNHGVMHACGHDVHTAMGLGAAEIVTKNPPTQGSVRFVFQPAEEDTNQMGKSGAGLMLDAGAFEGVSGVFGTHVFPEIKAGEIAVRSGPLLAACDKFDIKIHGKGSHGAYPELGLDPIIIASHVTQAIQSIVSRKNSALEPLVITIGGIKSNTYRPNIISDYVELTGTVRYFYDTTKNMVKKEIEKASSIADTMGGSFEIKYIHENPPVVNEESMANLVKKVGNSLLGDGKVRSAEMQMGGDDFSFLSDKMPACYFFLGALIEDSPRQLHTETFDVDENCLHVGAAVLAGSALEFLSR